MAVLERSGTAPAHRAGAGSGRRGCRSGGLPAPEASQGSVVRQPRDPPRRELCRQPGPPPRSPVPPAGRDTLPARRARLRDAERMACGARERGGGAVERLAPPPSGDRRPEGWPGYKFASAQVAVRVGCSPLTHLPGAGPREGSCSRSGYLS